MSDEIRKKVCTGECHRMLPDTKEYFQPRTERGRTPGLRAKCKECTRPIRNQAHKNRKESDCVSSGVEMTFEEIGKELGISRQMVMNIYNSAMDKLKRRLITERVIDATKESTLPK